MIFQIKYNCKLYDSMFGVFPILELKYRVKGRWIWHYYTEYLDKYADKISYKIGSAVYPECNSHEERMERLDKVIDERFDGDIEGYIKEIAINVIKKEMKDKLREKELNQKMDKYATNGWKYLEIDVDLSHDKLKQHSFE